MSDLESVKDILESGCFCHNSDLKYMFECMPNSIHHGELESDCDDAYCFHKKEEEIKRKLQQFKHFLETQGRFKVGDRVELVETPDINEKHSWGWLDAKHFLIKGAKATVNEVSYYNGQFGYAIAVDDESWIDSKGLVHPRSNKKCPIPDCGMTHKIHSFHFSEGQLRPIARERCSLLSQLWNDFYKKESL